MAGEGEAVARAFRLTSAVLTDGEIQLLGVQGQDETHVRIDRLNLYLDNVTNSTELAPTLMAMATCNARMMATGSLELRAQGYPLAQAPTFNLDFQTRNIVPTEVRTIIEKKRRSGRAAGNRRSVCRGGSCRWSDPGICETDFRSSGIGNAQAHQLYRENEGMDCRSRRQTQQEQAERQNRNRIGFEGSLQDP